MNFNMLFQYTCYRYDIIRHNFYYYLGIVSIIVCQNKLYYELTSSIGLRYVLLPSPRRVNHYSHAVPATNFLQQSVFFDLSLRSSCDSKPSSLKSQENVFIYAFHTINVFSFNMRMASI